MVRFGKGNRVYAFDFGTNSIKAVVFSAVGKRARLEAFGEQSLGLVSLDQDSEEQRMAKATEAFVILARHLGMRSRNEKYVYSSLPSSQVGVKQIKTPSLGEEELRSSLLFEARKHIPLKGEILLDYHSLGNSADGLDLLLVATTRQAVSSHLDILKTMAPRKPILDVPVVSLLNAWFLGSESRSLAGNPPASVLIVQIGSSHSQVCLWSPARGFFSREIPLGGFHFTEELRQRLSVDFATAEERKRDRGALQDMQSSSESNSAVLSLALAGPTEHKAVESLCREVMRSIRFFTKDAGQENIECCWLSGGSAADVGLRQRLAQEIRLPCKVLHPVEGLDCEKMMDEKEVCTYGQVLGLGLRGVADAF